jgi:hypothetical protein
MRVERLPIYEPGLQEFDEGGFADALPGSGS